jgi:hypothetical protein
MKSIKFEKGSEIVFTGLEEGQQKMLDAQCKIDRAKAFRAAGKTYKQISELTGLSVDWCKKNLKVVQVKNDDLLEELITLATRPEGCTSYEATTLIFSHRKGTPMTAEACKNIKDKAKRRNKDVLFRPAWMDTTYPIESNMTLNTLALDLSNRITEATDDYMEHYPRCSRKMVQRELVHLASGFTAPEGLKTRLERNEQNAQMVACRVAKDQEGLDILNYALSKPAKSISAEVTDINLQRDIITEEQLDAFCGGA